MAKRKSKKQDNDAKRNIVIGLVFTIVLVCMLGMVYAYWLVNRTQDTTNIITTMGCLSVALESDTPAINVANAYPISTDAGMLTTPYTFTLENECETALMSNITLELLGATTLDSLYVRSSLQETGVSANNSRLLSSVTTTTTTISGAKASHVLIPNVVLAAGASSTFDLRLWLDSEAPYEFASDKRFEAKIVIVSAPFTP